MSQTYSTANRDMGAGGVYTTRRPVPSAPRAAPRTPPRAATPREAPAAPAPVVPVPVRHSFLLRHSGLPAAQRLAPGVQGTLVLEERPGQPHRVEARLSGLDRIPDPAVRPALWLLHDLTVPLDLNPADLTALPHSLSGTGNQPGQPFTFDGNPPTYEGPGSNTLSLAISPGRFSLSDDGTWRLETTLDPGVNQTFHPLYYAGPEHLADPNQGFPSGTAARILTDLFMRPATVHPELPVRSQFMDRLRRIVGRYLDGHAGDEVLDGAAFTKAAVTVEGLVRATPTLMPTREACILLGTRHEA